MVIDDAPLIIPLVEGFDRPVLTFPDLPPTKLIKYPAGAPRLQDAALYGIAGEYVRRVEYYTEATPISILVSTLIDIGCVFGHTPWLSLGAVHHTNEFAVLCGPTNDARKGTAAYLARYPIEYADPDFKGFSGGLSTYEGLLFQVRDPQDPETTAGTIETDSKGRTKSKKHIDPGVTDKRKIFEETEWGIQLRKIKSEYATLSGGLRKAWDSGNLESLPKTQPLTATDAHICVVAHITPDELLREMTDISFADGFANRFPIFYTHRTKLVSRPPAPEQLPLNDVIDAFREALDFARKTGQVEFDAEASTYWDKFYFRIEERKCFAHGIIAFMIARAAPHIARFAMIYALLDLSRSITVRHIKAAEALWSYAEDSARFIFGDATGVPVADTILRALRSNQQGLTTSEITHDLFNKNLKPGVFDDAIKVLMQAELIEFTERPPEGGRGRPAKVFRAIDRNAAEIARLADMDAQPATTQSPSAPSSDGLNGSH
jgi:hypothetical protein